MAHERSSDEILDEMVFAMATIARHYGPGFNEEGLQDVRKRLSGLSLHCDSTWRVDVEEEDADFHPLIEMHTDLDFGVTVRESKGETQ